jgi:hypothetical protein
MLRRATMPTDRYAGLLPREFKPTPTSGNNVGCSSVSVKRGSSYAYELDRASTEAAEIKGIFEKKKNL